MIISSYYQPPKPVDSAAFRQYLKDNISELLENNTNSVFFLTGDLNSLNTNDPQTELGLDQSKLLTYLRTVLTF